ncbi:short chain dehydrogenase [Sphingobium faniae]|nr:short chain dehydrogenase [Sphingobium faniae]
MMPVQIDLTGKAAIITGSTAGIGFGIAQGLLRAGAQVVVNGCAPDRVEDAVRRLGTGASGIAADLSTADGHAELVAAVSEADIVVSNLGIFEPRDFFEADDEIWGALAGERGRRSAAGSLLPSGHGGLDPIAPDSGWPSFVRNGWRSRSSVSPELKLERVYGFRAIGLARPFQ